MEDMSRLGHGGVLPVTLVNASKHAPVAMAIMRSLIVYTAALVSIMVLSSYRHILSQPQELRQPSQFASDSLSQHSLRGITLPGGVLQAAPPQGCQRPDQCRQQLLLIGFHNTRTSMSSLLVHLAGAWVGEPEDLILSKNPLKYWSRREVNKLHTELLAKYASPRLPEWIGLGFSAANISAADRQDFERQARAIAAKLDAHAPWVLKDNRLAFTGELWLAFLQRPVCMLTYRHPALMAVRLSQHPKKGRALGLSADDYLALWDDYMLRALRACAGVPTVLLPTDLAEPATLPQFYGMMLAQLRAAGASDELRMPPPDVLHEHFGRYWTGEGGRNVSGDASAADQALQRACKQRLKVDHLGAAAGAAAAGAAGAGWVVGEPQLWPEGCPLQPSSVTLGLVGGLEQVSREMLATGRVVRPEALSELLLQLAGAGVVQQSALLERFA